MAGLYGKYKNFGVTHTGLRELTRNKKHAGETVPEPSDISSIDVNVEYDEYEKVFV